MATKDFDYKSFAQNLASQAQEIIPQDLNEEQKQYVIDTLGNFSLVAGKALATDRDLNFNTEQSVYITQIIAEWTFHKAVDVIRSGIPRRYWDSVMQKIAYTIFEVAKQGFSQNLPQEQILDLVEHHVKKCYTDILEDLHKKNIITDEIEEKAQNQSNIDIMAREYQEKKRGKSKIFSDKDKIDLFACVYILSFCFLFKYLIVSNKYWLLIACLLISVGIFVKFKDILAKGVLDFIFSWIGLMLLLLAFITYASLKVNPSWHLFLMVSLIVVISIAYFLKNKWDIKKKEKELEDIKNQMQELINPERMYKRLGVDVICLEVSQGLLSIADPDKDGLLLPKIAAMRQRLTDGYGYIIPNIRILDSDKLEPNEYRINIRNNSTANGYVYPDRFMVIAQQWDSVKNEMPEDVIIGVDPAYRTQVYWINLETANQINEYINKRTEEIASESLEERILHLEDLDTPEKELEFVDPTDVIIKHLEEELFKNADEILTVTDIKKLITLVESQDPLMVKGLLEKIDYHAIREVLVNLLREKISIKDITLIFSRLTYFVQYTTEPDELSEKLRQVLSNQICKRNCDEDNVIWALDLSESITKELLKNLHPQIGLDKTSITLDEEYEHNLVENIATKLMNIHQEIGSQPILICDEKIRLGLYRLLVRYIPTIKVLSKQEVCDTAHVKLDIVDTVELV